MKRREFLRNAVIGAAAISSLPLLSESPAVSASVEDETNFHLVAVSRAGTVANVRHGMIIIGDGKVEPELAGGGVYCHYNMTAPTKDIIDAGKWEARSISSFKLLGNWGEWYAGLADLDVDLIQKTPSSAVTPASLKIVCNIPFAGLVNPNPNPPPANLLEGFYLTIPDTAFGTFEPLEPQQGITGFSVGKRVEDKALADAKAELDTTRTLYLPTAALIPSVIAGGLAFALARAKKKGK